jgi:hypothetical protein
MAGFTVDAPFQVTGGAPGAAVISANTRVKGQPGMLGTQADSLTFTNGGTGAWAVPNTRTMIQGVFVVSASSQGIAQPPSPSPVPIVVAGGDARISSQ